MTNNKIYPFIRFLVLGFFNLALAAYCVIFARGINPNIESDFFHLYAIFSLFLLPLLGSWILAGYAGGITSLFVACFTITILSIGINQPQLHLYLVLFVFTSIIGASFFTRLKALKDETSLQSEALDERRNVLTDELNNLKSKVIAYERKSDILDLLKSITESLSSSLHLTDITKLIVANAFGAIGNSQRCLLYLIDTQKEELYLAASKRGNDIPTIEAKRGDVFDHWVLKYRQPLIVEDVRSDYRFLSVPGNSTAPFRSLIATPLISEQKITGVLRVDSVYNHNYTTDDLRLLNIVSNLASLAVCNSVLYGKTEELAIRDDLTGVFLRRHFKEKLSIELQKSLRRIQPLSFLMIDIDDFKKYNDKFGHMGGDFILRKLAMILTEEAGKNGIVGRYGGEEFAVILTQTDREKAAKIAESMRKRIDEERFILRRQNAHITVSVGLATFPDDTKFEIELIDIADKRLYKVKQKGKNKVCCE